MLRRSAIIALMLAFFLPLTKCSQTTPNWVSSYDYQFPIENVTEGINEVMKHGFVDMGSLALALITIVVFFLPAALAGCRLTLQSIVHLVMAIPAEWLLYHWTTIGQPQVGGIIAMLSWALLFVVGVTTLWLKLQHNHPIKRTP